jgi:hypothetical protein
MPINKFAMMISSPAFAAPIHLRVTNTSGGGLAAEVGEWG